MGTYRARRRALAPAVLLACAALVAAGCGDKQTNGGGDTAAAETTTATATTAQPTTATTPRAPDPGDLVAVALSTLLTPGDAPASWTADGPASLSRPVLDRCVPPSTGVTVIAPFFAEGDSVVLVQNVQLFPDERRARETVAALSSPSGRDCVAAWFADQVGGGTSPHVPAEEDVTWGAPEPGAFTVLPIGDDGAGLRVCLTGKTTLDARERQCAELSMYRVGVAVTTVLVTANSDAFPRQPVDELVATAVERLGGVEAATRPQAPPSASGDAVERARSVAPRLTDLPAGWSEDEDDDETVLADEPFTTNAPCRLPDTRAEAVVWSPRLLELSGSRSISSTVAIMPGERAARELFAALNRADVRDCIARDFHEKTRAHEADPADVGPVRASVFEPPAVGVDAAGQRMTIEVFDNGLPVKQITDGIVLRSGRAVAIVWQQTERRPSEQPLTRELLALTAERLRAAGR